jgi:hypothetical protein
MPASKDLRYGHLAAPDPTKKFCTACGRRVIWAYWFSAGAMWQHRPEMVRPDLAIRESRLG